MLRLLLCTLLAVNAFALDRCTPLVQEVRRAHWAVFGVDYPYQYGVSQLKQESNCRDILSNDGYGSEGIAQITMSMWAKTLKANGIEEVRTTRNNLRAQAFIMKSSYNPKYPLWVMYQRYNAGYYVMWEIERAGIAKWDEAYATCKDYYTRKKKGEKLEHARGDSKFTLKSGIQYRSNCDINYEYSQNIFKYGKEYGDGNSSRYIYW